LGLNADKYDLVNAVHSGPVNFKKSRQKKLVKSNKEKLFFHEIAFLPVLTYFPVQKLILGHF